VRGMRSFWRSFSRSSARSLAPAFAAWLAGACVCAAATACRPPADATPPIHVVPGAAARWGQVFGAPTPDAGSVAVKPARVHAMREGEELGGPNAIGRPGDWILENDEVAFVVDRLGSSAGFAESGGNLVDAADAVLRKDELGQVFTYFGVFPRQAVYDALGTGTSPDGSAWIDVRGRELYEPGLAVATRYTLRAPDRALLIETSVTNTGAAPIAVPSFGDAIQWGGAEKIAPGKPTGFKGTSSGPYVGGVGRFVSYAVTSTEGAVDGVSGGSWTDTTIHAAQTLAPGETSKYARILLVGERADSSSLVAELMKASGQSVASVQVDLVGQDGEGTVPVPDDARVVVRDAEGKEVLTIHAAGSPPALAAELPSGRWTLAYAGGGGRAGAAPAPIDVTSAIRTASPIAARAKLAVTRAASARVRCVTADGAPMPCKLTFERTDGGPAASFGPAYVAGGAKNQVTTADGIVSVPLAPGAYQVTASRGPEYALDQAALALAPGADSEIRLSPRRVLDTAGYLGCDFHQHTMLGADAPVGTRDRVIANAAEGVEVAVATEHNVVANFEPIVESLHLEHEVVSIPGDELTSDASRHAWGHANAWPMAFVASDPRGGAPAVRDIPPRDLVEGLRKSEPQDFVFQINHPRSGSNGYFDLYKFDRKTGVGTDPDYESRFDTVEVWNGRNVDARAKVLDDFFALLRTSHPVTPTADTDTHGVVGQEAGYPRTFVRVADDGQIEAWDAARTEDVVRGVKTLRDVVLTNGPMLRVTANGVPVGGVVRGGSVHVKVHVESAPWVRVDRVEIRRASAAAIEAKPDDKKDAKNVEKAAKTDAKANGTTDAKDVKEVALADGAVGADVAFTLQAAKDDAFIVVASGHAPMTPVLGAAGTHDEDLAAILPWAMTGAIWIDADGNGESLGRLVPVAPSPGLRPPPSRQVPLQGSGLGPGPEPSPGSSRARTDGGAP
jgi:hypothetical protein